MISPVSSYSSSVATAKLKITSVACVCGSHETSVGQCCPGLNTLCCSMLSCFCSWCFLCLKYIPILYFLPTILLSFKTELSDPHLSSRAYLFTFIIALITKYVLIWFSFLLTGIGMVHIYLVLIPNTCHLHIIGMQ